MRPLELVVEGFRSWGERVAFDFRQRQLLAVVGPIGSGKSSLLDAITFALYARTPRIEKESAALIRHGCDEARVELLFEAGGTTWRAIRVIKRKGSNLHALIRHPDLAGLGEPIERLDRARDIDERLLTVIGLDFTGFCRSVLLAQNQFARFLEAPPGDRDAVLKGLFGFERLDLMRERARQREDSARLELRALDEQLGDLQRLAEHLAPLQARLVETNERTQALEDARPQVNELLGAEALEQERRQHATNRLTQLRAIRGEVPAATTVQDLGRGETARKAAREQARKNVDEAEGQLIALDQRSRQAEHDHRALSWAALRHDLERATAEAAAVRVVEAERETACLEQQEAVERARRALIEAEQGHHAAALREHLEPGQPCPVCEQLVAALPPLVGNPELEGPRQRLARAEGDHQRAVQAREAAGRATAAAVAKKEAAARALDDLRRSLGDGASGFDPGDEPQDRLGLEPGHDPRPLLRQAAETLRVLRAEREVLRASGVAAREQLGRCERDLAGLAAAVEQLQSRLDQLLGRLLAGYTSAGAKSEPERGLPQPLREHTTSGLLPTYERLLEALEHAETEAQALGSDAEATLEGLRASLSQLLQSLGVDPNFGLAAALAEGKLTAARLEAEVAGLHHQLRRLDELRTRREHSAAALAIWSGLAEDLKPSRLLRHLLDEERRNLAGLASERFEVLSGGRYRFSPDGSFAVVDLANAEEVRRLDTLSGGETFLAALALALALAEMVAGGGGRLDAFFLDEGFGSLDQEHLRLALDGIERLVVDAPERLVVVVSHVPEVRERFDDVIVLDRDPHSGASIVVVDARA